ncbi:unnamed protein product [Lampetra fluviatilis]
MDVIGALKTRQEVSTAAGSHAQESSEARSAPAAAILPDGRDEIPAKPDLPPKVPKFHYDALKKRLPLVKEFVAMGGIWEAFRRCFAATCDLAGWTEEEVLWALPTAFDDDALAAFDAIPSDEKSTDSSPRADGGNFRTAVHQAPEVHHAFCSVLMVLAKYVCPGMDHIGRDSLVLKMMLVLVQELKVVMPATEEDDLSSLQVARCLQAHLNIQQRVTMVACTGPPEGRVAPEDAEPLQACASLDGTKWKTGDMRWSGMAGDVHHVLKGCAEYARRKPLPKMACPPLKSISVSLVNELVTLDVLGPFPSTPRGP